ncbi:MAG: suppressor of fused domain protein [Deltaproteobacteria bacterium]|nr:suppressor of fused domain protein [Deltaproteobacteria bacterium]
MTDETESIGWDAITAAMENVYGKVEPKHWATPIPWMLGGPDPLHGVSAYESERGAPHWHYVGFGLTELWGKETDDPQYSGFGFELTMRVIRSDEEEPPTWPVSLMQNLARYVYQSGNIFVPGQHMDSNGPICLGADTLLTGLAFAADAELPRLDTPHGEVEFVQIVGVTADELGCAQTWNTDSLLELLRKTNPLLLTDLDRKSLLDDPALAARIDAARERDGASCSSISNARFGFEERDGRLVLRMGAKQVALVAQLLPGRLLHGRGLALHGQDADLQLEPGAEFGFEVTDRVLTLRLTDDQTREIAGALHPKAGRSEVAGLILEIEKTELRDAQGNIVEVIG